MANYILIKVDTNDADYTSNFSSISDQDLETIKPLIEKIKDSDDYENFPFKDYSRTQVYELYAARTEDDVVVDTDIAIELFLDYVPSTEFGFHAIELIEIYDVGHIEKLL